MKKYCQAIPLRRGIAWLVLAFFSLFLWACSNTNNRTSPEGSSLKLRSFPPVTLSQIKNPLYRKNVGQIKWKPDYNLPIDSIEIDIKKQLAFFFQNKKIVGQTAISTGKNDKKTPKGSFKILEKDRNHKSSLYGHTIDIKTGNWINRDAKSSDTLAKGQRFVPASMLFFMRLTYTGIGLHSGFLPGRPASHGCIRLPSFVAASLFDMVSIGTPVVIK